MDMKIPRIKIDLHEDVHEEDNKDALPKTRTRAASSPEMIHRDMDLRQKAGGKITKAESFDTALILRYSEEEKSELHGKMEGLNSVQPTPRKEKKVGKQNDNGRTAQMPELTKRKSLPSMLVPSKGHRNVDAIVSPLLMRKFNKTRGGSTNPSIQKGARNAIETTSKIGASIPHLPKIKRSWTVSSDSDENLNNHTSHSPTQKSPSLSRKDKLDVYNLKKLRKNEEEFNVKGRPRSSSLTLLVKKDDAEESVETSHQPSMHWRLARVHMETKNMKLPDVVHLYGNNANGKHGVGNKKMLNFHPENNNITGRTNYSRNIVNKDTPDETMQMNLKQGISLEKRLEAIEIKHGIMHEDTQSYQS